MGEKETHNYMLWEQNAPTVCPWGALQVICLADGCLKDGGARIRIQGKFPYMINSGKIPDIINSGKFPIWIKSEKQKQI